MNKEKYTIPWSIGMSRIDYLRWHADGNNWVQILKTANNLRRHAANCPWGHKEITLRFQR